jgi:arylsulfatase A-like enzyme
VGSTNRFDWSRRPLVPANNVTTLAPEKVTFAEVLRDAGYATGLFGKWHLGDDPRHHPRAQGFDEAVVSAGRHFNFQTTPPVASPPGAYLADFLTDRATDFIRRHRESPFLLCLHHFAVHSPHEAKPELTARFRERPPAGSHHSPVYAAMIASLDASVGRVLAVLDELKVATNTLVIFTSDNGGVGGYVAAGIKTREGITDNAPLRGGKGMLYEGGVRVPFLFRWPGRIAPGVLCEEPIISVDLLPTFAALAGSTLPAAQPVDGVNLVPLLFREAATLNRPGLFWHFPGYLGSGPNVWRTTPVGAIRQGDWKLLEFFEDGRLELYDVRDDVRQQRDLAQQQPDKVRDLHGRLQAWRAEVEAPMPTQQNAASEPNVR